ncbi:MAG: nitrous oxide reductase family maturation protein NosD [Candidatus Bathyarchaeia archaeon]
MITIKSDGNVIPSTVPIYRNGSHYHFAGNISGYILVERDNIVIDGEGYFLKVSSASPVVGRNGMFLSGRNNVTIQNVQIQTAWHGISIENCSNITISTVTVTQSLHGVFLHNSSNNNIVGNILASNYRDGIQIVESHNNIIHRNTIRANLEEGITLERSSNNSITENALERNLDGIAFIESPYNRIIANNITTNTDTGMWIYKSAENLVSRNNFIDNPRQIYTFESHNAWNNSLQGNYWSDYTDVDLYSGPYQNETGSDGIWDNPYVIDENNQDNYPIVPEFPQALIPPLFAVLSATAVALAKKRKEKASSMK